ncbi:colicin V biosynthesis protein [Desulfovibrio psychrotolerans]|uniref:Colicin V biosynthesis protein n=2 Tax=Desulfovibrio psychrotolerans TaxID=415242 RepID=A0A7J0BQ87_9BACT|nr:colicin V biosynthesis protein [Desulfovibrio psychrotolerans]
MPDIRIMNALDITFIVITGFFLIRGLFRGLITEMGAIVGVIGGFLAANAYYAQAAPYVSTVIADSAWAGIAAYAGIFIGVIIGTSLLAAILHKLIGATPAAWLDHFSGLLLGGVKGVLICTVLLACITYFMPNADFVYNSQTAPYLQQTTAFLRQFMPERLY